MKTHVNLSVVLGLLFIGCGCRKEAPPDTVAMLGRVAAAGDTDRMRSLISEGLNINARDRQWGETPLHYAAESGHLDIMQVLLEAGADVNARTDHGGTALMSAALQGQAETVKILLDNGAGVNAKVPE